MEAYCVKCRMKREIQDPVAEFNSLGNAVIRGKCPVCGVSMYRIGRTEAHAGLQAPPRDPMRGRSGKLVIVESPAKAKTVGRFLGKGYTVRASVGHVRDLLKSQLSVDVENNFAPKYRVPNEKKPVVKELKQLAKEAEEIFLATDPDREGEAIAWHLMEAANIEEKLSKRVVFHEITEGAIAEAFANPRKINMKLVDAQQARRVLDRLVGFSISPLLWEKVRNRLSAGRVQSVALRLIVEREREIDAFDPVEYWSIAGEFKPEGLRQTLIAKLAKIDGSDPELPNNDQVRIYLSELEKAAYVLSKLRTGERRRKPNGPFITSSLQQEASRKLGYTARRTMMIAQQLYEGIDIGENAPTGLITYMRTDSTNIAETAVSEARNYIENIYGKDFLPAEPIKYTTKVASAQEAHEAIRPTSVGRVPEQLKPFLSPEQFKVYQLIWQRFLACQMESAIYSTQSVEISTLDAGHSYLFRANGSVLKFPGYQIVYQEAKDEDQKPDEEDARIPAGLKENQSQRLVKLLPEQHFTEPPPRFTEASLVQVLEQNGIGRPSTYAPILSTIQARGYVIRDAKRLIPTETGILVNDLVMGYFEEIINTSFTAEMESDLDLIADGKRNWTKVMRVFYDKFEPMLKKAQSEMPVTKTEPEKIGRACPECGKDLVIRWGRYGKFISCSGFPECRHTEALLEKIGVICPKDGGDLVERKTRRNRVFYACGNYPNCDFTSWKKPIATPCPNCKGLLVINNKREVQCIQCEETFLIDQVIEPTQETA